MSICSPSSVGLTCILALALSLSPSRGQRQVLVSAVNLGFLWLLVPKPHTWALYAVFLGGTYAVLKLEQRRPSGALVTGGIALTLLFFACVKGYAPFSVLLPLDWVLYDIELVGLSYMLFKFIHVLVDLSQGQIKGLDLIGYTNYQLGLFTLVAGPIQRYGDFQRSWDAPADAPDTGARGSLEAWNRLLLGMLKVSVMAALLGEFLANDGQFLASPEPSALQTLLARFYVYPIYLWANFSGYTDFVVGCAALVGQRLPENFNRPFLARNVIDFWDRWHITLSRWIRDYVFMSSYKFVAERFAAVSKGLGYFLLFGSLLLAGMWHGSTAGFVVFGALHGLGAAVTQAYGDVLKSRLGRAGFLRYQQNPWIRAAAIVLTFHFVCFTFLFFALGVQEAVDVVGAAALQLTSAPWSTGLARLLAVPAAGLATIVLLGALQTRTRLLADARSVPSGERALKSLYWSVLTRVAVLAIVFVGLWAFEQRDPVVVYQKF